MELLISSDAACPGEEWLLWDTVWNPATGRGDWGLAGPGAVNPMGLVATSGLETAAVLSLFTDKQCPLGHPLAKWAGSDRRGYWGDAFLADDEPAMGSLLWLLERAAMIPGVEQWAVTFAQDALAWMIDCGAAAQVEAQAEALPTGKGLALAVQIYAADGQKIFDRRFDLLWRQLGK